MFSLRTLFIAVAYAALVCAALVYRSPLLGSLILGLTVVVAFGATIAAWRSVEVRGFYGPMALAMWLYMLVLFYEPLYKLERSLPTSQFVFWAWSRAEADSEHRRVFWHEYYYSNRHVQSAVEPRVRIGELNVFYYAIHCASALLLGLLAGSLTVWVERKRGEGKPIIVG